MFVANSNSMKKTFIEHHFGKLKIIKGVMFVCIGYLDGKDLYLAASPLKNGITFDDAQKEKFRNMTPREAQFIIKHKSVIDRMLGLMRSKGLHSVPLKHGGYIWTCYPKDTMRAMTLDVTNEGGSAKDDFGSGHLYYDRKDSHSSEMVYRPVITF